MKSFFDFYLENSSNLETLRETFHEVFHESRGFDNCDLVKIPNLDNYDQYAGVIVCDFRGTDFGVSDDYLWVRLEIQFTIGEKIVNEKRTVRFFPVTLTAREKRTTVPEIGRWTRDMGRDSEKVGAVEDAAFSEINEKFVSRLFD